jgi:hypothetical protein
VQPKPWALSAISFRPWRLAMAAMAIVGGLAEQIDGDDRAGDQLSLGLDRLDRGFQLHRIKVVGVLADVDEHRGGAQPRDHLARGREGEAGAEHRIARPDAPGHQRQHQGLGAVGAGDGVPRARERRQLLLERLDLGAHHIGAVGQHLGDGGVDPGLDPPLLGGEVDKGDGHEEKVRWFGAGS